MIKDGLGAYRNRLRALRKKNDWTQGDLARELGVNQATVSRWEKKLSEPVGLSRKALMKLFEEAGL